MKFQFKEKLILVCMLFIFMILFFLLPTVLAADERCGSISLKYQYDGKAFDDMAVNLYKVAHEDANGVMISEITNTAFNYEMNSKSGKDQLEIQADLFEEMISKSEIISVQSESTNENGIVNFSNLDTGIYMVSPITIQDGSVVYSFDHLICFVPYITDDYDLIYDISATPKGASSDFVQSSVSTLYKVKKQWNDFGNTTNRPSSVVVDIYCNSSLYKSVVLSEDNNWSYSWPVSNTTAKWSVKETDVPKGYTSECSQNGTVFTVTNTYYSNQSRSFPKTGDSSDILLWLMIQGASLVLAIFISRYFRRHYTQTSEKK